MTKNNGGRPRCDLRLKLDSMKVGDEIVASQSQRSYEAIKNMMTNSSRERGDVRFSRKKIAGNRILIRCIPPRDTLMASYSVRKKRSLFDRLKTAIGL